MATKICQITGDSVEAVAYVLMAGIAETEGKVINDRGIVVAERDWLISTFRECIRAVAHRIPAQS